MRAGVAHTLRGPFIRTGYRNPHHSRVRVTCHAVQKGVIDSEGSPPDLDPEYDWSRDWQERLADRPPAEWWDDHLSGMETAQAKQAEAALQRITRRGCPPVVVLEPLREVWDYTEHPPVPRYVVLAHAEHIQRLIEAAANVADDLLFYGADRKVNQGGPHGQSIRSQPSRRPESECRPATACWGCTAEQCHLVCCKAVAHATGSPHSRDVTILLRAVRVQRSEGALKQLARRAGGGLSRPRAKRPPNLATPEGVRATQT